MRTQLDEDESGGLREALFTPGERAYCDSTRRPAEHYAARFAAKEALLKALAYDGRSGFVWRQAEVQREPSGKPRLILHGLLKELAESLHVSRIFLSLSHTKSLAAAHVILES